MNKFGSRQVGIVALICFIWSTNLIALKYIFAGISPVCTAGMRFSIGAAGILAWAALRHIPIRVPRAQFIRIIPVACMAVVIFVLFSSGLDRTTVQHGSILIYSQPFFTAVFAHFAFADDRLTMRKIVGLIIAFIGVGAVFMGGEEQAGVTMAGDAMVLSAAAVWAYLTVYCKKLNQEVDPMLVILYELLMTAPVLIILSWLGGEKMVYAPEPATWAALLYSGLVTVSFSFVVWNQLLTRYNASALSSFVFLTPVFGVLLGGAVMHEGFHVHTLISLALVAAGIWLVNYGGMHEQTTE